MRNFIRKCRSKPPILWALLCALFLINTAACVVGICVFGDCAVLRIFVTMLFPILHLCIYSAPFTKYEKCNIVCTYAYITNAFVHVFWELLWGISVIWPWLSLDTLLGFLIMLTLYLGMREHDQYVSG